MKVTPEQRAAWAANTADDAFNRWLNPQIRNANGTLDLDRLYAVAARYVDSPRERYAHLNAGQQRMTVGNLLRRAVPALEYEAAP